MMENTFNVTTPPDHISPLNIKLETDLTDCPEKRLLSRDKYEVFYVLEGSVAHCINEKRETLHKGDLVFMRPYDSHSLARYSTDACICRFVTIPAEQYEECCNHINENLLEHIKTAVSPPKCRLFFTELMALEQKFTYFANSPIDKFNTKGSLAIILVVELFEKLILDKSFSNSNTYPAWFELLLSRFETPSCFKLGLDEIIKPINYNQSYICRIFKKHMGVTMSQYLCSIRLKYSAILLSTSDKTVTEIVSDLGFSSHSFFNVQFKKNFNTTPKQYRELYKK